MRVEIKPAACHDGPMTDGLLPDEPGPSEGLGKLFADEAAKAPAKPEAYRVLARKYRPSSFDDLIGQDAMVRDPVQCLRAGPHPTKPTC